MVFRRLLTYLPIWAMAMCAWAACKGDAGEKTGVSAADLDKRCEQLGKVCGDKGKHDEQITQECKQAAKKQVEKSCTDKAVATYDCYEKELCGKADKIWTIDDLRLLADRHKKCETERNAVRECVEK